VAHQRHHTLVARSALATAIALLSALALASSASTLEQQIGAAGNDAFGAPGAVQGDTLAIGTAPQPNHTGAAHPYQRTGDTWNQTAKLVASDSAKGDGLPVGNHATQGAAYTFTRAGAAARNKTA
jgi:hypothetical protein